MLITFMQLRQYSLSLVTLYDKIRQKCLKKFNAMSHILQSEIPSFFAGSWITRLTPGNPCRWKHIMHPRSKLRTSVSYPYLKVWVKRFSESESDMPFSIKDTCKIGEVIRLPSSHPQRRAWESMCSLILMEAIGRTKLSLRFPCQPTWSNPNINPAYPTLDNRHPVQPPQTLMHPLIIQSFAQKVQAELTAAQIANLYRLERLALGV